MARTSHRSPHVRRTLLSGAALGTALAVGLGGLVATPAFAAPHGSQTGTGTNSADYSPSITVSPGLGLEDGPATLSLDGEGFPTSNGGSTFGGAYIFFGAVTPVDGADSGSWAPSKGGRSGSNYDYAGSAYQSMVSYPGDVTGLIQMDADGDWSTTLPIPGPVFTSAAGNEVDCYAVQCGVITIGAHGSVNAGVEVFAPVSFGDEGEETVAPTITTQPSDRAVLAGETAEFTVVADGDPAPSFQWQSRQGTDAFADIAGATSSALSIEAHVSDSGRQYQVVVTNSAGSVTSSAATLTVTEPATPAEETTTTLAAQAIGTLPTDFAGQDVTLTATVAPAGASGTVEFFSGAGELGSADVVDGAATLVTEAFTGGAHQVTAVFVPADSAEFLTSTSTERTFRIVDLEPVVSGIELGSSNVVISGAQLNWTIANYVSLGSPPSKTVISGDVVLSELPEGATAQDRADQEFVFSNGTGYADADGNRVISFEGSVRLTSGTVPEWNFHDPQVHIDAAGNGYITAVVDGIYRGSIFGGEDETYGPVRVTVATFRDGVSETADGVTQFDVVPVYSGQVAAGTWSGEYTGATFANEFLQYVNSGVRSFFYESGTTGANLTKPGRPISLAYESVEIPAPSLSVEPVSGLDRAGDVVSVSGSSFEATARPTYPGAPATPAGFYVSLGWIAESGWRPSEGNAAATRVAVTTKWVQGVQDTEGQYVKWDIDANGRASFAFDFDEVTYSQVLERKPETGDYRLAVYSIGASGAVQANNEFAQDVEFAPAAATSVVVAAQPTVDFPTDFAGEDVTVSATVAPVVPGTVEFFVAGESIGEADVVDGVATVSTDAFTGGAHPVTATFVPEDLVLYSESSSDARTYRIVDLTRVVDDITVGTPVESITGAELEWSIANYYSALIGYEFSKEAVSGNVSVPGPVDGDAQFNSSRLFTFTGGTGTRDAAGNAVISFDALARVGSGELSRWDFEDPQVHVNAAGDGYITAVFSGFFGEDVAYGPQRVTVATFTGAAAETADGQTSFTVDPVWEGQTAPGTWSGEYTGSFPNEFASLLHTGIRPFFYQSGTTGANLTKPVLPVTLAYVAGNAPAISGQPSDVSATEGESASFTVVASGAPAPSIQWQTRASADAEWTDVAGANAATLEIADVELGAHGSQYRVVVANVFGEQVSSTATLSVAPAEPTFVPEVPPLTGDNEGDFEVVEIDGRTVTVFVGDSHVNTWIGVTLHSDPQFLGWYLVGSDGLVTVTIPEGVYGAHQLSYTGADGELLGWVDIVLPDAPVDGGDGGSETDGGTTGSTSGGKDLAGTGGELPLAVGGVALLLLLAGAAVLIVRRRAQASAE